MSVNEEITPRVGIFEKIAPILVVLSIGLAFMVGVLWQKVNNLEKGGSAGTAVGGTAQAPFKVELATIKGLFDKDLIKFGDAYRKVLFVEVGDPSCPYCHIATGENPDLNKAVGAQFTMAISGGKYNPPVKEMRALVDAGKASFVYIYYPGHGTGEMAMKAMYCANEKGKFWDAHDLLMSRAGYKIQNGSDVDQKDVPAAQVVGNDVAKSGVMADFLKSAVDPVFMKSCLDSGKYDARLESDIQLAQPLFPPQGGTPNFFVNDTNFGGAVDYSSMKPVVDGALK